MAQQRFDIKLGIQADVEQAKSQIQQLQKDLSALTQVKFQDGSLIPGLDPKSLGEASAQIAQLKNALNGAFNEKTGKLDLGQFQASLQKSNLDINTLKSTFQSLGPAGTTAFADLAKAVASAEAPVLRVGDGIRKFMTTFANSARYMAATRALNTFVGSIQNAFNYAQDLNKSLNNIAIVTGASTDKMAEFAAQANKAAQKLSVTTTGYTDAALIYYQQGLSDQEVAARTETTMKMSNVTGESAQEVSSYMTAIWNNFYDGSQSIEEFADKITALGAATASSSAEIAGGLQQFAAVANTVGLSYDYAASALATIVAQTRQSESTVGNGLRTLFSRLQGLKLEGETEDGVSLNKYSAAVEQFGVQVLDQKGELREMDDILMDMGEKWQTLSRAQQVALAQTVGGVRQYTTLVALMDNFDKFKENVSIAQGAEGTLQQQQEIYERSWEASRKRIQAAAQSIYQDIIDDDFFITLNDLFAGFLKIIDQVIKGLGGVKGILSAVSAIVFTLFNSQITDRVDKIAISLSNLYHPENIEKFKQEYLGAFKDFVGNTGNEALDRMTSNYATNALNSELELKSKILALSKNLSQENQEIANNIYKQVEAAQDLVIVESKALQETERQGSGSVTTGIQVDALNKALTNKQVRASMDEGFLERISDVTIDAASLREAKTFLKQNNTMNAFISSVESMVDGVSTDNLKEVQQTLLGIQEATKDDIRVTEEFKKIWGEMAKAEGPEEMQNKLEQLGNYITENFGEQGTGIFKNEIATLIEAIPTEALTGRTKRAIALAQSEVNQNTRQAQAVAAAEIAKVSGNAAVKTFGDNVDTFGQKVSTFARNASSWTMQINSLRSAITAFNDKDIAPWEKFVRVTTGLGMTFGPNGMGTAFIKGIGEFRSILATNKMAPGAATLLPMATQLKNLQASSGKITSDQIDNWKANLFEGAGVSRFSHFDTSFITEDMVSSSGINRNKYTFLKGIDNLNSSQRLDYYRKLTPEQQKIFDANSLLSRIGNNKQDKLNFLNDIKELEKLKNTAGASAEEIEQLTKKINETGKAYGIEDAASKGIKSLEDLSKSSMSTGKALWTAFGPMIKIAAIIGAIVVAIYTLKKAYEAWYATTLNGQIEQYNEKISSISSQIETVTSQIQKLNVSLNNLKETVSDNNSLKEYLGTLSEGTLEYQKTVRDINSSVFSFLEENNLKANSNTISFDTETGTYSLNEKYIEETLNKQAEFASSYKIILDAQQTALENERNLLEAARDIEGSGIYKNQNGEYVSGKFAQENDVINQRQRKETAEVYQQFVKAGYDSAEAIATFINQQKEIVSKNSDSDNSFEQFKSALEAVGITDENLISQLFSTEDVGQLFSSLDSIDSHLLEGGGDRQAYLAAGRDQLKREGWDLSDFTEEEMIEIGRGIYGNIDPSSFDNYKNMFERELNGTILGLGADQKAFEENIKALSAFSEGYIDLGHGGEIKIGGDTVKTSDLTDSDLETLATMYGLMLAQANFNLNQYTEGHERASTGPINDWIGEDKLQTKTILGLDGQDDASISAWKALNAEIDEYANNLSQLPEYQDYTLDALKSMGIDAEIAKEGFEKLSENAESWWKKIEKGGIAGAKAMGEMVTAMTQIIGLQDEFSTLGVDITDTFGRYLKDEGKTDALAAQAGDMDAILRLRQEASKQAYEQLIDKNLEMDEQGKQELLENFKSVQADIQEQLNSDSLVLGEGTEISSDFYTKLDKIVSTSATSIEEANAILASLNLDAGDFDLVSETKTATNTGEITVTDGDDKEVQHWKYNATNDVTIWHPVPKGAAAAAAKSATSGRGRGSSASTSSESYAKENYKNGYQTVTDESGEAYYISNDLVNTGFYQRALQQELSNDKYKTSVVDPRQALLDGLNNADTSGSGGGGGGSGSGGKEREQKAYEDEIERYHYLLKTMDAVNKKYDELENAREKAYGTDEIEIMDKEIENLQQQIGLQKQYLDAISQDYVSDRAAIAAYGAQFDENGNIINYEEIYRRQIDLVNSAAGDDEAADKAYEQFKKVLEQYEKTNELLQDTKLSYQELLDKAAELNLEKITVSVEYNVAISDRDREYLEWLADNMGEGIDKTADKIANLSKQMETYAKDAQTYGEGIDAIFEQVGIDSALEKIINGELTEAQLENLGLTKQQIEQIQDYTDKLRETQQAEKELAESAVEELTNAFSEWNEELTDSIDKVTSLNDFLEKYRDILGLLNEDLIGSTKALNEEIDAAERQNNIRAIDAQQQRFAQAQRNLQMLNDAYQAALNNGDTITANALEDSIKEAEDAVQEAHQDMLEATSNALDALEKQWESSLERISKEYAQAMTGMSDISYFEDAYNRQKEMSDWYLDDYEKYYNLNKLVSRINKDLSSDDALVVSGKLNGLLGKINGSLAEGAQISEATVGYYEKELDLIEAQMALEAARNAKSEVRMVRDNEGNMSYVYTANAEEVEKAQDDYQEKWYELMNYTTEQQDELQEKMISSMQDFIDRATEAAEKFGIGTDAFNEELGKIQQDFAATFGFLGSEAENAFAMMTNAKNNWWQDMTDTLKRPIASESDFTTSFGDWILGQMRGISSTEDWINLMNSGMNSTLSSIYQNGQQYVQNQEQVLNAAGSSLDSIVNDTSAAVQENQTMASEEMDKLNQKIIEAQPALENAGAALENFSNLWGSQMSNLTEGTATATAALNEFYEALSKVENISSGNNFFSVDSLMNKNGKSIADIASTASQNALSDGYTNAWSNVDFSNVLQSSYVAPELSAMNVSAILSQIPNGTLDQNVHIEAVFPNVVNHSEIELAFNNLQLSAAQYVNRK